MILRPLIFAALLLSFSSFAQISFEENIVSDDSYVIRPMDAFFGDIDNDGDLDIMTAGGRNVVWFENIDGLGTYGTRKLILNYEIGSNISSPFLKDIDGDGDLDALASATSVDKIIWFENLDGLGTFGPEQVVEYFSGSIYVSDMDSDGDMDILSSYTFQQKIVWMENLNGLGQFGSEQLIDIDVFEAKSLKTADLDGDGDNDILLTSYENDTIIWYENLDGNGSFGTQKIISTDQNDPTSVYAADIDNDGDLDVVSSTDLLDIVGWHENIDGNGNFAPLQIIATDVEGARALNVVDIDSDGDQDIFVAAREDNYIAFYENLDGQGTFSVAQIISDSVNLPSSISIGDADNDGSLDVMCISSKDAKITWYKNLDGQGAFGNQNIIYEDIDNVENIYLADIDGDGDKDLLSASHNLSNFSNSIFAWFENIDGQGSFGKQKGIDYHPRARYIRASDVDGDGDMDVIGGAVSSILWYENMDGLGNFGEAQNVPNGINTLTSLEIADFDGDNDIDILFTTISNFGWIENVDGLGDYSVLHEIVLSSGGGAFNSKAYPADLDNDGDIDIISWQFDGGPKVIWFENLDGMGNFSPSNLIYDTNGGSSIEILSAADMDLDGDIDVIISSNNSNEYFIWLENIDGLGNFGNPTTIVTGVSRPYDISLGDLDNDGDLDIGFTTTNEGRFGWFENIDGQGNFGPEIILYNDLYEGSSILVSDLNDDGDNDIIGASRLDSKIIWYGNSLILSLYENNPLKFLAYPNPTNDLITIQSETTISSIKIYNNLGQLVLSNGHKNSINISPLKSGIFFLNITDLNGTEGTTQVIKN